MVTLDSVTYRIERVEPQRYVVIRISDEVRVGAFRRGTAIEVEPGVEPADLLLRIARVAVHSAKTSWVYRPTPAPPPVAEPEKVEEEGPASSVRRLLPVT
jgi:hypothetical protein